MVHLYGGFIQGALPRFCITFTIHTHARGNHARHQPAHRDQLGVQSLAQGHFNSNSGGSPGLSWDPRGCHPAILPDTLPLSHCRPRLDLNGALQGIEGAGQAYGLADRMPLLVHQPMSRQAATPHNGAQRRALTSQNVKRRYWLPLLYLVSGFRLFFSF